jgi:two-component system sensor histidine kinase KdpD
MIIGKPRRTRLDEFLRGTSLLNRLVRASGDIDITVITGDPDEETPRPLIQAMRPTLHSDLLQYMIAAVVVCLVTGALYALESWDLFATTLGDYRTIAILLLFVVIILGNSLGRGPIFLAAAMSAVLWDVLFIPPKFTLFISQFQDALLFLLYLLVAVVTGNLTARAKNEGRVARDRENRMSALYTLANEIAEAKTIDDVAHIGIRNMAEVFDAQIALFLPQNNGRMGQTPHPASTFPTTEKDVSIANYAFERDEPTGRFTDTLAQGADAFYQPLSTPGGVTGVMGIKLRNDEPLTTDQRNLLNTFVNHIALALERELLESRSQSAAVAEESEKLYATLLDSISHELRTPLTTIRGTTSALLDPATSPLARELLGQNIQDATERLNYLVQNLLDMSRLQAGHITLNKQWTDVRDLVEAGVRQVGEELATHDLIIDIPADLPLVYMDSGLMEHVIFNLLHNAAQYTPPETRIRVTARTEADQLVLSVADRGPGLPPDFVNIAFDKFSRAPGSRSGGAGLGLSICKGFVEAHGGTITAENRPTRGGARFTIRMPIGAADAPAQTLEAAQIHA